ncbi:hypothetical protein DdX_12439 [Ditylenchus destructor]|uniref:Uncharacterized protein n=1 Tax=Ditylenchus destructor TaxID=166010 RepID=A0AAD4MYS0_9BILA|nr:hypothetical protein DdX_12439 [Ditylenchus destructor]
MPFAVGFECYSCNTDNGDDDSKHCVDKREVCPDGVESCSTVVMQNRNDGKIHIRKFCTSPGTPIYQYLLFFPGSSLCQNIQMTADRARFQAQMHLCDATFNSTSDFPRCKIVTDRTLAAPPSHNDDPLIRAKRVRKETPRGASLAAPPAPPNSHQSSLLCVCSSELCNGGSIQDVLHRTIFSSVDVTQVEPPKDSKLIVNKTKKAKVSGGFKQL